MTAFGLSFSDHMHGLDSFQGFVSSPKRFEP